MHSCMVAWGSHQAEGIANIPCHHLIDRMDHSPSPSHSSPPRPMGERSVREFIGFELCHWHSQTFLDEWGKRDRGLCSTGKGLVNEVNQLNVRPKMTAHAYIAVRGVPKAGLDCTSHQPELMCMVLVTVPALHMHVVLYLA